MTQVSDRLASLSPSATLAMSQKSGELKAQGIDVINLSVGEPDFNTPDFIKEAAKKAIDDNFSRYSPVAGYPALRNAIVAKLKNENGLEMIEKPKVEKPEDKEIISVQEVDLDALFAETSSSLAKEAGEDAAEKAEEEPAVEKVTAEEIIGEPEEVVAEETVDTAGDVLEERVEGA